jgi:hypothetical protein
VVFTPSDQGKDLGALSGQHLVSGHRRLGRTFAEDPSHASARWARRIALLAAVTLFATPETASAQSFWNWGAADYDRRPVQQKRAKIKRKDPAETAAKNAAKPVGPLVIAVSVEKQRVKVYDSNGLFAEAPVSTGTKSHPTPYGVFSIIQKNRHHVSNLYHASMPYMQRITWSGVAMHTGPLPGYAASHGCIRLPNEFAARLWTWTKMGTRVIVAPGEVSPVNFSHPKLVTKMMPLPTVSAVPAAAPVAAAVAAEPAPSTSDRMAMAQQRTADARETIEGMRGTLSDATPSAPVEAKPVETSNEPKHIGIDTAGDTPVTLPGDAKAEAVAETRPRETTEKAAEKPAENSGIDTAKAQDRINTDDSEPTAATAEAPASKASTPAEKTADVPAQAKPAATALEISKPADIMKLTDGAAAAAIEPAKPAVVATPRRHNHVAVFISRKDKKLYIRHGYEPVFDTPVEIADADRPLGTHVFTARGDKDDSTALHWSAVSLPQVARRADPRRATKQGTKKPTPVQSSSVVPPLSAAEALDRITIPPEAMEKIASIIAPGGSLLISDHGLTGWETGRGTDFIVPLR